MSDIIVFTMPHPQRFTFISDATDEFPNNKNNSFKVRLPTQLQLSGDHWYASLWSLSVPDEAFTSQFMFGNISNVMDIGFTVYRLSNYDRGSSQFTSLTTNRLQAVIPITSVVSNTHPIKTGVDFWKNAISAIESEVDTTLRSRFSSDYNGGLRHAIPEKWKPTFTWNGLDMVLEGVDEPSLMDSNGRSRSWFGMNLDLARKFGFVNDAKNKLGPNVRGSYFTYEEGVGGSVQTSLINTYNLTGPTRAATSTKDTDSSDPRIDWFEIKHNEIYFSRALRWTFTRLNDSFQALLNTKETVMVYSDLVQSSVVGYGRFPLLREVTLERTGQGRVTVEPYHREWIPIRSKTIDIVEIELATASGPLTQLAGDKTIVTAGLQHEEV